MSPKVEIRCRPFCPSGAACPSAGVAAYTPVATHTSGPVAAAVLRNGREAHRRTRNEALGVGDELVEIVKGPGAALAFHGSREVETAALAALLVDDAVEVRADAVGAALFEGVAGGALLGG